MSFITKRERVFKEFAAPVALPPRDEGKLKAYSSCTDARAWSHFCSDKTEHLVEIIKRNSDICRGKFIPCNVIIEMMMVAKNAEIARLKHKIGRLEQMLTSYDQLDLTCEQKCEISTAHAIIKAANKSLEALPPLELDMSGFTEGIDSEGFQTGKSGGDEASVRFKGVEWTPSTARTEPSVEGDKRGGLGLEDKGFGPFGFDPLGYEGLGIEARVSKASKINQSDLMDRCGCNVSTSAHDTRVEELEESLISKDAKLNAMQNTIAVMENDVCEPYCVYAHIFTALEKIYGTLRQNEKYRLYLDLMSAGKDTRTLDIKGKILFKLKILEKFSISLISPCSERFKYDESCECYAAQVKAGFSLSKPEPQANKASDVIRTQLIADIMEHDEMKEIVSELPPKTEEHTYDVLISDNYSIDTENISRIKTLQVDYEDLMNTYEDVKHERDSLKIRCQKYEDLEKDLEDCRDKLREYNALYGEREYYRKRSEELDSLKEQYLVLADETSNLENQLKAENEINNMKTGTIDDLRNDNISLETKLNELTIAFEKEKNSVLCKLKESDCTIMCQEQQIRSLSSQIDRIIEQDHDKQHDSVFKSATILDEIETLKHQIKCLNDALYASEDEKMHLQEQFEEKLKFINELKLEIEEWKSSCDKTQQQNEYLEKYTENFRDEVRRLVNENMALSQEVEDKTTAVANLINVINNKSQEINRLMNDIETKVNENKELLKQLQDTKDKYGSTVAELENERREVIGSLQIAKQESKELLEKVKDYDNLLHKADNVSKSLEKETENCNELQNLLSSAMDDIKKLQQDLCSQENNNSILLQEIQRLREINNYAADNISSLQNDKDKYKTSCELMKRESETMEDKLKQFDDLREQLQKLRLSHERLVNEKEKLANDLQSKVRDLDDVMHSVELTKKESEELLEKVQKSENLKEDLINLSKDYRKLVNEKQLLEKKFNDKSRELDNILDTLSKLKAENGMLLQKAALSDNLQDEFSELKKAYHDLENEKKTLQQEIDNIYNALEDKIEENRDLSDQIKNLEKCHNDSINTLQDVNLTTQTTLQSLQKESEVLLNKLKNYESLLNEYENLKRAHNQMKLEKEKLDKDLTKKTEENIELQKQAQDIMAQAENFEKALIDARQELVVSASQSPYDDVIREIEEMKREKLLNNRKIKELLDKLDESDSIICNLSEDLLARDDKIAILENHINSLEDEVKQLHRNLAEVVDTGEQIKDNSVKKIDQTLDKMEAHHSKATHNMKMELAKLNNEKAKLEDELSLNKIKSEESFINNHKHVSQIIHLQNEREIIVTDIKQLEMSCVGDSNLSPTTCGIEDIIKSLEKIQKCIDAKNSKSAALEQTLQKVQNSSQLLLSKADEAKKLVEKEKQKIINEKEEAVADKLRMEGQLLDLKAQLEQQNAHGKSVIKDLEAEILNQKLLFDKLNDSTQSYIKKLKDEMQTLQDLYQKSIKNIGELQEKMSNISEEKDEKERILNKVNNELIQKSKEVSSLQNAFDAIKKKPVKEINVQVGILNEKKDSKAQTDTVVASHLDDELGIDEIKDEDSMPDIEVIKANKPSKDFKAKLAQDQKSKDNVQLPHEVQILTASIKPSFNFVKTSYIDYKKKRLGHGKLEQYSISTLTGGSLNAEPRENPNLIDIYNRESDIYTESSKAMKTDGDTLSTSAMHDPQISLKYSQYTNNNRKEISDPSKYHNSSMYPQPGPSSDKDLFLIYKDSESSHADNKSLKQKNINSRQYPILIESVAVKHDRKSKVHGRQENLPDDDIQDRVKTTLDVNVPRVLVDDSSPGTDTDVSRIDPETRVMKSKEKSEESYKLSRVEADFILFKNKTDQEKIKRQSQQSNNFGLEYILDSIKHEMMHPENINKKLHKSLSDDLYQQAKGSSEGGISIHNPMLVRSSDGKTASLPSDSKSSQYTHSKSVAEQSVMVNIDATDYYENKIRHLSQQLDNTEKDYKKKMDVIKAQYDNNIKGIINEHNQGVKSIQNLHEETLQDIIKIHENEVENLRTMSIDAMRKADKLERENRQLKTKVQDCDCGCGLDEEPIKMSTPELRKRKSRRRSDTKMLTKTNIEAFNVKPKLRIHGPCTCSLDVNVSDTIRNIFQQVDVEQRKLAEHAYLKYIANKIMMTNVEALDVHELSFLHLKVCRTWKSKLSKEEALQKRIDTLESELLSKQRCTQQHIADLDRKVAEERRRLQEAREAVCRCSPEKTESQTSANLFRLFSGTDSPPNPPNTEIFDLHKAYTTFDVTDQRSAGDLVPAPSISTNPVKMKAHKSKPESRATLVKLDAEERRVKKLTDEPPTRLRRSHERAPRAPRK